MGNKLVIASIFIILMGLCINYYINNPAWHNLWIKLYFVWDKLKDLLLVATVFYLCKDIVLRKCLKAMWFFLLIRLLWEGVAVYDYNLASQTWIVDILFGIDLIIILFIIFISHKPKLTHIL